MFLPAAAFLFLNTMYLMLRVSPASGSFPRPLSAEEEREALLKSAAGDIQARNLLIEHNLRLVAHVIKKYYASREDQDDLISIGTFGLIKAISSFNPEKGARLATYASRCIENEILMFLRKASSSRGELSIDEPLKMDWDGNELLLRDVLGTDPDTVHRDLEWEAEKQQLRRCIGGLNPRERKIICLRFGLEGGEEMTQKQVADEIGISQSYISRLEKRIMKKLKTAMEQ